MATQKQIETSRANGRKGAEKTRIANTVHGSEPKKLYHTWQAMKSRCNNLHNNRYHCYGGRGIKVCKEWNESFIVFREWALSNGWKEGLTIDRMDSNGDYTPDNCKWSTQKEQQNNRRDTIMFTYQGKTLLLHFWCDEYQIPYQRVVQRMKKLGWSFDEAMEFVPRRHPIIL